MICHQQDKKEKDVDGLGKRRKTSQSEDVSSSDNRASRMLGFSVLFEQPIRPEKTNYSLWTDSSRQTGLTVFLLSHRRRYPGSAVTTGRLSQPSCRREKWTPVLQGTTTKSKSWPPSCSPSSRRTLRSLRDLNDRYGEVTWFILWYHNWKKKSLPLRKD